MSEAADLILSAFRSFFSGEERLTQGILSALGAGTGKKVHA